MPARKTLARTLFCRSSDLSWVSSVQCIPFDAKRASQLQTIVCAIRSVFVYCSHFKTRRRYRHMPQSQSPASSVPPTVPKSSGGGPYIAAVVVLAILIAVMVWFKFRGGDAPPQKPVIQSVTLPTSQPPIIDIPPPPEIDAAVAEEQDAGSKPKVSSGNPACGGKCSGDASSELRTALSSTAAASRSCYERALRSNTMLQGRLTVAVRVASNGSICSATVTNDTLKSQEVTSCVAGLFRGRGFPPPTGGTCVDVNIPLSFTPRENKK